MGLGDAGRRLVTGYDGESRARSLVRRIRGTSDDAV
ncbi:hypothetical protein EV650_1273 [Kribbella kalugense]|uniref:Uncharacterized protein n=1 Tax=Kribbella kalugense TaxID=2512221 RepID=A0A4R7ZXI5_9ACTN|nr:hypothetical protein EV650_1273 [Kribbella kalugense]